MPAGNSTCRGCGAAVRWLPNDRTGKLAPLDVQPVDGGNVSIRVLRGRLAYTVVGDAEPQSMFDPVLPGRFTLHFATCPKAHLFRRCGRCHRTPCGCATG